MAQINKPNTYFNPVLYTGTGSTQSITGVNFQPDFVWLKERNSSAYSHNLFDVVRGVLKTIQANNTGAEQNATTALSSFNADGFTVGTDIGVNENGTNFVGWNWKAGGTASSNTGGSITSSVSASTTSGFSIVSYTGTNAVATVGHGLGVAPSMIMFKNRNTTDNWNVFHASRGNGKFIRLNESDAEGNTSRFNNTSPTSSVFSLGASSPVNGSGNNIIAYCFAEKKGFSKFGSYVGNGANDGTFVYTGFKPAFVMVKRTNSTGNWHMADNKRLGYNPDQNDLFADLDNSEDTGNYTDIVSNGFKFRNSEATHNGSGDSFIYMAFAENPLVGTNGIPATAR